MRLRAHDVGDAEPLLIAVLGLDHAQHQHGGADAQRAATGEIERAVAFRRVVDDDHEFRRVSGLVAAALLAHRLPPLLGSPGRVRIRLVCLRRNVRESCHAARWRHKCGMTGAAAAGRRTKPTMSLTAFMVSAAMSCARSAPSANTESI